MLEKILLHYQRSRVKLQTMKADLIENNDT